jgi:hypothetical protein
MKVVGILAEFESSADLMLAAEKVRKDGYKHFDCHSPFPIHGMDEAMGLKRSPLGWMVGIMSLTGAGLALLLQWWTSAVAYPVVISGKPFFSWQAFFPVTFGIAVLFGAVTAVFGMFGLNKLPRLHHPVFYSENFGRFSEGAFFISIESTDEKFEENSTNQFLKGIGSLNTEVLKGE